MATRPTSLRSSDWCVAVRDAPSTPISLTAPLSPARQVPGAADHHRQCCRVDAGAALWRDSRRCPPRAAGQRGRWPRIQVPSPDRRAPRARDQQSPRRRTCSRVSRAARHQVCSPLPLSLSIGGAGCVHRVQGSRREGCNQALPARNRGLGACPRAAIVPRSGRFRVRAARTRASWRSS